VKTLRRRITEEGEIYHEMKMIKMEPDTSSESCIFFVWPLDLVHVINEDSPFYDISAADLARDRFELLVIMEGIIETSSMNFQARLVKFYSQLLVCCSSVSTSKHAQSLCQINSKDVWAMWRQGYLSPLCNCLSLKLYYSHRRTSYLPNEILWGHRFESMILYRRDHNNFHINFSAFHGTYEVDTPTCTARTLDDLYAKVPVQPFAAVRHNPPIP
jgi:hypothetical protein